MWYASFAGPLKLSRKQQELLIDFGGKLASEGWFLRSHGTTEMDSALSIGCSKSNNAPKNHSVSRDICAKAYTLADRLIAPSKFISHGEREQAAFMVEVILGPSLKRPARFVLTWSTPSVAPTRFEFKETTVVNHLLKEFKIPVFDLSNQEHLDRVHGFLDQKAAS